MTTTTTKMRSSIPLLSKAPAPASSSSASSASIQAPPRPPRTSSLPQQSSSATTSTPHANAARIPSIRLITATPSATGLSSSEASTSFARALEESWDAMAPAFIPTLPSPLAPKAAAGGAANDAGAGAKRKLVPKKSKLSILGMGLGSNRDRKAEERAKDLSDVVRRVGLSESGALNDSSYSYSTGGKGGFEIYVDPSHVDPDIGEIVLVKKKKSRVALDGVGWGANGGAMGEITNVPKAAKEGKEKVKEKAEEKEKWWATIGRGRKDSKDKKEKENKISHKPIEYIHDPHPRSKTPEPFPKAQAQGSQSRMRFNSLDSGMLLNPMSTAPVSQFLPPSSTNSYVPNSTRSPAPAKIVPMPTEEDEENQEAERRSLASQRERERAGSSATMNSTYSYSNSNSGSGTRSRSGTLSSTVGGMLAPPGALGSGESLNAHTQGQGQGSIALRAIRSVRSLARIGSWAQLKNMPAPGSEDAAEVGLMPKEEKKSKKGKKAKEGEEREGKEKEGGKKKKSKKEKASKKEKEEEKAKAQPVRHSTSSFEVGALTSVPGGPSPVAREFLVAEPAPAANYANGNAKTLGAKKSSAMLLGLGLPSTMRLPSSSSESMRVGSSASSVCVPGVGALPGLAPSPIITSSVNVNANPANINPGNDNRLSVESAYAYATRRPSSVLSSGSSLRPLSTTSTNSRLSSSSGNSGSGASVRWDEQGLETVREMRRRERRERDAADGDEDKEEKKERRTSKESRRSSEGRRRTALMDVFPEVQVRRSLDGAAVAESEGHVEEDVRDVEDDEEEEARYRKRQKERDSASIKRFSYPILTIEEATSDGHGSPDDWDDVIAGYESGSAEGAVGSEEMHGQEKDTEKKTEAVATPVKRARARPLSEQMLGRSRPKPMYEDDEGVLSILDAATNDLAMLINNLDLQATPSTPDMTPLRPSASMSPSPTPVSTLEKAKALDNGSPTTATAKKRRLVAESPLGPKSVVKNSSAAAGSGAKPDLFRQMSTSSISSLRPYAQSRGYPAKSANMVQAQVPVTVAPTSATTSSATMKGMATGNQANASLIAKQIAPWATLIKGLSPVKEKHTPSPSSSLRVKKAAGAVPTPPSAGMGTFRPGHKRTMTPAPEPEPEVVLQPLRPAMSRLTVKPKLQPASPDVKMDVDELGVCHDLLHPRAPSSLTFGSQSRSSSRTTGNVRGSDEFSGSLTPVFQRIQEFETLRRPSGENLSTSRSSRASRSSKGSRSSYGSQITSNLSYAIHNEEDQELRIPISRETRRVLGLSGTMGGSDVSMYRDEAEAELDASDPDSDVPDELRCILAAGSGGEETDMEVDESYIDPDMDMEIGMVMQAARSHPPAALPLDLDLNSGLSFPVFRAELVDAQDNHFDIDVDPSEDDDTKKSFDFTGELKKLNESGGSDRRSFVEQLENAFRTPAKVDLRYDFGVDLVPPPVPALPLHLSVVGGESNESSGVQEEEESLRVGMSSGGDGDVESSSGFDGFTESGSHLVDMQFPSLNVNLNTKSCVDEVPSQDTKSQFDMFSESASRIVDVKAPSLLQAAEITGSSGSDGLSPIIKRKLACSTSSRTSETSEGELNTSFRFGGLPRSESSASLPKDAKPLTLSDIIPPPAHARSLSGIDMDSFMLDGLEDDSVLKSIYAKIVAEQPPARSRVSSDPSEHQEMKRRSVYKAASRPTSGISFEGFTSFDEVRRGFEFHNERPSFYPPAEKSSSSYSYGPSSAASAAVAAASQRAPHRRHESVFSIASVSSFGHVINPGSSDPFEFGLPSLQERPSSEDMTSTLSFVMSDNVEDTFAYLANKPRRRVESDASSFYFHAPQQRGVRGHRRRESNMSVSSQAPPISLYNRSFGHHRRNDSSNGSFSFSYYHHRRNDSSASASSVAMSYVKHGANGGLNAWARHRRDQSVDSVMSDFSAMHLGRPGIGDKMFDNGGADHGPLPSISASPPESASASQHQFGLVRRRSFDSILDEEQRSSMAEDSLFEQTGYRSSVSDSVFGVDLVHQLQGGLLPPDQFRPLSVLSRNSVHSPMKDDDTMISMLGGGHVRRRSVGSIIEASPCVRVEKRKHLADQGPGLHMYKGKEHYESPNKARIVEKPSIASTSSYQFGGERMIKAQRGLLERQSLEEHCLVADGEDLSASYHAVPVFTRPGPTTRSRSSTCTSSSGGDTPPLSASDGSSISGGSQSSIDLSHINIALSNATHPVSTVTRDHVQARARARARGAGHRRRYSKSHVSRSSVYETIEEEMLHSNHTSPAHTAPSKKSSTSPTTRQAVFIVDSDTASLSSKPEESMWDDERGIVALRKYYALRDEAQNTVTESRRLWSDTPFSIFAIQSFQAPGSPAGMQALLQHSVQNYGPLPSELRPHRVRSRTSSRPSPYPQGRTSKMMLSPEKKRSTTAEMRDQRSPVLQQVNVNQTARANKTSTKDNGVAPFLGELKPFSPLVMDQDNEPKRENAFGLAPSARPRVGSNARRTALGWSKRSTGAGKSSADQKENAVGGVITTPGDNLRLNRPRPRGRPTPGGRTPAASARPPVPVLTNRPIRI